MKVLITGHRGFIGRHVFADWRRTHGYNVHGIDYPNNVENFTGGDYGLVIHLAAWADIRESREKPHEYYQNNVVKAKPLFEWCRETNTRLIYASSSAVEGPYWDNPYGMSKWINEIMAPPNSVGMRMTTVYGPECRDNMMFALLKNKKAKYITKHKRDWIHVKDVCRAIRYLWAKNIKGPVSVGYGKSYPVKDLAEAFGQYNLPINEHTPGEADDNVADTTILRSTGWFPTKDVLEIAKGNADL
tara:strand:- start:3757 stop:4488 length:732 start_codon:yes stop_codon:yes gene_type:complete